MFLSKREAKRRRKIVGALLGGGVMFGGFVESCDNRLIELTRFFDPCGTILANCAPGQLAAQNADIGDPCYLCTRPEGCIEDNPFLNICD
ncbi:MAG: hypothetical protein IH987_12355 [Planctomycetes bacterium]|nr:hypothetical protein [Planctomycetota bacterium]